MAKELTQGNRKMHDEGFVNWVLGGVVTVVATLAGVVGHLYKVTQTQNSREIEELKKKVADCESDRINLRQEHEKLHNMSTELQIRLARLERQNGDG